MSEAVAAAPPIDLVRWRFRTAMGLGVIGFAAAVASLYASPIEGVTDLGCGRVFDCAEVLGSEWGAVAGIPLGVLGGAYFATWMGLLIEIQRSDASGLRGLLTWFLAIGATVSLLLLGVLFFAIEGSCLYCLITHAANLGAIALIYPIRQWRQGPGSLRASARRLVSIAFLAVAIAIGLLALYQIRVATAEEKAHEETIW